MRTKEAGNTWKCFAIQKVNHISVDGAYAQVFHQLHSQLFLLAQFEWSCGVVNF